MKGITIGVIGGTGVYGFEGMKTVKQLVVDTPFGNPSSKITIGEIEGIKFAFIARHDVNHRINPTEVPYRANIYALKTIGVKYLISITAVGSLQKEKKPEDFCVIEQFIDRTKGVRDTTFFEKGIVAHVSFGDPTCKDLSKILIDTLKKEKSDKITIHEKATYVCMEGPAFSTRAESEFYRKIGGDVIGMTALTEAKLAREAEISYGCIALVTDYDSWYVDHGNVTVEEVVGHMRANTKVMKSILPKILINLGKNQFDSPIHSCMKTSIMTNLGTIDKSVEYRLHHIIGKYMPKKEEKK